MCRVSLKAMISLLLLMKRANFRSRRLLFEEPRQGR